MKISLKKRAEAFVEGVAKCGGSPENTYGRDGFVRILGLVGGRDGNTVTRRNLRRYRAAERAWERAVREHTQRSSAT